MTFGITQRIFILLSTMVYACARVTVCAHASVSVCLSACKCFRVCVGVFVCLSVLFILGSEVMRRANSRRSLLLMNDQSGF